MPINFLARFRSFAERLSYTSKNWFRAHRRQLSLRLRDKGLARRMTEYRRLIADKDWSAALPVAIDLSQQPGVLGDRRLCDELSQGLTRLGAYGRSAQLKLASRHLKSGRDPREWMGEDLTGKVLLLDLMETDKQGLATAIQYASSVRQAADRCGKCIVLVERRLVPLFQRSFPDVDVREAGKDSLEARRQADRFASTQHVAALFEQSAEMIESHFVPLKADPTVTTQLRDRYASSKKPLVGISWGSSNIGKDLPPLTDWLPLLDMPDVQFVSLQYGRIRGDLDLLCAGRPERIIYDETVDQLLDMDRFAAQLAALDAVVTISNTGAHLAGAMGIPTVVLLGDMFKRSWPVNADRTPYYPRSRLIWKERRPWSDVMDDAARRITAMIAGR